jgi:DNA-binding NtrC family response regulator
VSPPCDPSVSPQPALIVVLDRTRLLGGGARHSLANIEQVTLGRGVGRVERVVEDGVATLRLPLDDAKVSASHSRIERVAGGRWRLHDRGSTNGCHVNGHKVNVAELRDGDVIEIGHTFLRLRTAVPTPADMPGDVDAASLTGLPRWFGTLLPALARELETLGRIARSDISVLLLGETGTGKELLARAIHAESGRPGAFVAVNCGALPAALAESLLFGHKRGAFSGAVRDEPGFVRAAEGGTLLLDEVADLGPVAQTALLRVLQEREVTPIGATAATPVDTRVVAATHRPLDELAAAGPFRQDLLARLTGFTFSLPSLRDRIDDLGLLVAALLRRLAPERAASLSLSSDAVHALLAHPWPLNVRELEQRLKAAAVITPDGRIEVSHLWKDGTPGPAPRTSPAKLSPAHEALSNELLAKLREYGGNVTKVGEAMGKSRTQVQRWLRRLGIDASRFRT